jgi:adenosylhomocysteine nucleosidase
MTVRFILVRKFKEMRIGIIGAMSEEIDKLLREMTCERQSEIGKRVFYEGHLYGQEVVLVFSRWGKVAAATTATQLILDFKVDILIFTGIAGALSPDLQIGDIVVGQRLYQHDMDARPLMQQFEIPLTGKTFFETDPDWVQKAQKASERFVQEETAFMEKLNTFGISKPRVWVGDIASGDKFVGSHAEKEAIHSALPDVLCVEMEGAAVAQVCDDFAVPFLIIRTISDTADDQALVDFPFFLENIASEYAHYIFRKMFEEVLVV